jgi:PAS domain S-box-containing protein
MTDEFNFGGMVERAPFIITIIDQGGIIRYLNRTELGFSREFFIGKPVFDFINPEHQEAAQQAITLVLKTRGSRTYLNSFRNNGTVEWYENQVTLLNEGDPDSGLVIFSVNVTGKKDAESRLLESEERYRRMVEDSPDAVVIHCEGRIVYINQTGLKVLGVARPEQVIGSSVIDFVHPDMRGTVGKRIMESMKSNRVALTMEERFILPSGRQIDVEVTGQPLKYEGKQAMQVVIRDVTDRKMVESALALREKQQALILNSLPVIFYKVDPVPGFPTVWISEQITGITGFRPEDFTRNPVFWEGRLHPDERDHILQEYAKIFTHESIAIEYRWQCADGQYRWFYDRLVLIRDEDGKPGETAGIWLDITDRKKMDEDLKESELKHRKLFRGIEQSPAAVIITGTDGAIEYVNPRFAEMTGYQADHVTGKTARILKPGRTTDAMHREILATIRSGKVWQGEYLSKRFDGTAYWESVSVAPIFDAAGRIINFIITIEDISDRKQMIAELIAAREKAEQSDRLKSAFLANMSHEIRTPMNAIVGFSEMLSDPELPHGDRQRYASIIQSRSGDLMHLIDDLLEISRIESGNASVVRERVLINQVIDELGSVFSERLSRVHKSQVSLVPDKCLSGPPAEIRTDGYILKQVFSNLIDNAIKYTVKGFIRFGYRLPADGRITFYVEDSGIGIDPSQHAVIFEHFRQADHRDARQYGGTGLGLSICKGSLALLGGEIHVESEPGNGSRFLFTLPYEPESGMTGPFVSGHADPEARTVFDWTGKRFLLVEDEETNMEFLHILLGRTGAELVPASNGRAAMGFIRGPQHFDLVLLDVRLPDADGWELAREIREVRPGLRVIAQTAYAMSTDRQKSQEAGCDGYVSKPIRKELLLKTIANIIP